MQNVDNVQLFNPQVEQVQIVNSKFLALPPGVQRLREFQALLNDERLYQVLGSAEKIESIERTENSYLIYTENYVLQVNIRYVPETRFCGPAKFEFEFCDPISRKM